MSAIHTFEVEMTCKGCEEAVERVLKRLLSAGIEEFTISLPEQKVTVISSLGKEKLLEVIRKTGKKTTYLGVDL